MYPGFQDGQKIIQLDRVWRREGARIHVQKIQVLCVFLRGDEIQLRHAELKR